MDHLITIDLLFIISNSGFPLLLLIVCLKRVNYGKENRMKSQTNIEMSIWNNTTHN